MNKFEARHVQRSHTIVLKGVPKVVFPLFTPAGEKLWVEGWDPVFLHPASGETQEGMVFVTGHDEETTYWSLVKYEPAAWLARYARVTPASRFGFVEVECKDAGNGKTRAKVTYIYTALSEIGNRFIDELTAESYCEMIDSWQEKVNSYLASVR